MRTNYLFIGIKEEDAKMYRDLMVLLEERPEYEFRYILKKDIGYCIDPGVFFYTLSPISMIKEVERAYCKQPSIRCYITSKPIDDYTKIISRGSTKMCIYEIEQNRTKKPEIKMLYGKISLGEVYHITYKSTKDAMELIYHSKLAPELVTNFSLIMPEWLQRYYDTWLVKIRFKLTKSAPGVLNHYCKSIKKVYSEDDFKFLGMGGVNTTFYSKNTNVILRINEVPSKWCGKGYHAIKTFDGDSGFRPIISISDRPKYLVVKELKPIKKLDPVKVKDCLERVKVFILANPNFMYTDYKTDNFMQTQDESTYYVSDIDLEGKLLTTVDMKHYTEIIEKGKLIRTTHDQALYSFICRKHGIKPTKYAYTVISMLLYEMGGYDYSLCFNAKNEHELIKKLKAEKFIKFI